MNVRGILEELGYNLKDDKGFYRTKPLYRESGNPTSLRINKDNGRFIDFSASIQGTLTDLVKLTLDLKNVEDAEKWIENKIEYKDLQTEKPRVEHAKTYKLSVLDRLLPSYHFYTKKKVNPISEENLKKFKCGLATYGKMVDRITFPIINHQNEEEIIGFAGRDVTNKKANKWKLLGPKSKWCYPLFLNIEDILEKDEVILVESVGDVLALYEAGIKNSLCIFGVMLGAEIKKQLISLDIGSIIVSTNNEPDNNNIGNEAAESICNRLNKILGNKAIVKLPPSKDFGKMEKENILKWYEN